MRILIFLFLGLNFLFTFCESKKEKVICGSSNDIILNENEIVFMESLGFPKSTTEIMMENCTINIFGKNAIDEISKMSLTLVLTNYLTQGKFFVIDDSKEIQVDIPDDHRPIYYETTSSSLVFIFIYHTDNDAKDYSAFQGYIIYEQFDRINCNMMKISQPLLLADETEIILIHAPENSNINVNCSWNFITSEIYGFKFTSFDDISDAIVIIKNSSDYIITDIYTKPNFPYYNVDNNITVTLQVNSQSSIFNALISIVKKNPIRTFGNCVFHEHDGYFTWSSSFYPNNAYCNLKTTISSNQQLFVMPNGVISDIEKLADPIRIKVDNDKNKLINFLADFGDTTAFGPYENGTTKNLYWNILSDGSITPLGFQIDFLFYECKCNNLKIIVPCEDLYSYTLIDTDNISISYYNDFYRQFYCANMKCNFTIVIDQKCPTKYIIAQLYGFPYSNSIFKIISNNQTIVDLSRIIAGSGIIKPNSYTILEFSSGPALNTKSYQIVFQAYEKFKILPTITLTHDIPWHGLDQYFLNINTLLPIKLSDELKQKNDMLQLSHTKSMEYPLYLKFYNDVNLTLNLQEKDLNSMNLKSFVILIMDTPIDPINVIAKKASSENCKFQDTTFHTSDSGSETFRYSMISDDQGGPCKMVIVNHFNILVIKRLWTNANEKQVEIFSGFNQQNKMLSFNEMSASQWQSLVLTSKYFVIIIPPNASFIVDSYEYSGTSEKRDEQILQTNSKKFVRNLNNTHTLKIPVKSISITSPCLSLLETNYYGRLNAFDPDEEGLDPIVYNIQNVFVQFTVRDFDVSKNGTLGFQDAKGNITMFTAVNQTVEYFSTTVSLIFAEPEYGYKGARIYLKAFY